MDLTFPNIWIEFSSTLQLVLKGLIVGIIISAPMGPVGILCIQRTMKKGRIFGIVTGAGAALSDFIYALMTGLGMSFVIDFIERGQTLFWLKLMGSIMLLIFGIHTYLQDPRKGMRTEMKRKGTLFYNFISGFGLTISNPLIVFLFIALFNMFTFVIPANLLGQAIGYLSIIAGAMLWWLGLTYVIAKMKDNFGLRGILYLNRSIGSIVICSSIVYAIMTLWNLWVR
ncbi:MAG: LysE family transporter [Bacteroidaceae bacterium]|nr:LysE family transporter [Bacteroidaceae bacterium]